jgi:hypothetical protein
MMAEALADSLERARRALERDEVGEAAATVALAAHTCAAAHESGLRLEPRALATLKDLHSRCFAQANEVRSRIARDLGTKGSARRAASAYQR